MNWEKDFDNLFVYTDFDDEHAVPVRRSWRPTFGLPDREIASLKLFIENSLQENQVKMIDLLNSVFLEKARMQWKEGELDKWEINKKDWNELIELLRNFPLLQ